MKPTISNAAKRATCWLAAFSMAAARMDLEELLARRDELEAEQEKSPERQLCEMKSGENSLSDFCIR